MKRMLTGLFFIVVILVAGYFWLHQLREFEDNSIYYSTAFFFGCWVSVTIGVFLIKTPGSKVTWIVIGFGFSVFVAVVFFSYVIWTGVQEIFEDQ